MRAVQDADERDYSLGIDAPRGRALLGGAKQLEVHSTPLPV